MLRRPAFGSEGADLDAAEAEDVVTVQRAVLRVDTDLLAEVADVAHPDSMTPILQGVKPAL